MAWCVVVMIHCDERSRRGALEAAEGGADEEGAGEAGDGHSGVQVHRQEGPQEEQEPPQAQWRWSTPGDQEIPEKHRTLVPPTPHPTPRDL
eukprot:6791116-Prymnesium_polylepis.1